MADITKCTGDGCMEKESCYRFTATDSDCNQSYFSVPPINDGKCEMFWGEQSESILNNLQNIFNGKENNAIK